MEKGQELLVMEKKEQVKDWALRPLEDIKHDLTGIRNFQKLIRSLMVEGIDYGVIPGAGDKPTLLKPGAEKLAKLLLCADYYDIISEVEDWDKEFFAYKVRCTLKAGGTDQVVSQGLGECNSKESKYRFRWIWPSDVPEDVDRTTLKRKEWTKNGRKYTKYRIENDDVCSVVNTIMKMAKKRALVDAALSAGRLSEIFTQDVEDIKDIIDIEAETETTPIKPSKARKEATPTPTPYNEKKGQEGGKTAANGKDAVASGEKLDVLARTIAGKVIGLSEQEARAELPKGLKNHEFAELLNYLLSQKGEIEVSEWIKKLGSVCQRGK